MKFFTCDKSNPFLQGNNTNWNLSHLRISSWRFLQPKPLEKSQKSAKNRNIFENFNIIVKSTNICDLTQRICKILQKFVEICKNLVNGLLFEVAGSPLVYCCTSNEMNYVKTWKFETCSQKSEVFIKFFLFLYKYWISSNHFQLIFNYLKSKQTLILFMNVLQFSEQTL